MSLALRNCRDNRAQLPLSRWLGYDACDGVGHLLGIRRCRGSVLCVKRRRKRIYTSPIEGQTLGVCRRLPVCRDGGRIGPRLNNGGVDAKGRKFIAIRLGESLQGKLRRSIQAQKGKASRPAMDPICSSKPLPCLRICDRTARFTRKTLKTLVSNCCRTCSRVNASSGPLYNTPALLTTTSRRLVVSRITAMARSTGASSVTSISTICKASRSRCASARSASDAGAFLPAAARSPRTHGIPGVPGLQLSDDQSHWYPQ